jgi:hypothetical protein
MNIAVSFWRTWPGFCAILLGVALLFFLIAEHSVHLLGVLPIGILLLCPLLHIFMHKGHGSHGGQSGDPSTEIKPPQPTNEQRHH